MQMTTSIGQLATALAKAQAEIQNPAFDSLNPHFKSKYASLAAVRDAITPPLTKNGLALTQWPCLFRNQDGAITMAGVRTILLHESGEKMEDVLFMPIVQPTAHGIGSGITYARRYAMQAIAGVSGDDDDDGNTATGKPGEREHHGAPRQRTPGVGPDVAGPGETKRAPAQDPLHPTDADAVEVDTILKFKEAENMGALTEIFNKLPADWRRPGTKLYDAFKARRTELGAED